MNQIDQHNQNKIGDEFFLCIRNGIIFLSQHITYYHHKQITTESSNGSAEIMQFWNKRIFNTTVITAPANGDHGAGHVFICQFIPNAQVIINAKKNISQEQVSAQYKFLRPILLILRLYPFQYITIKPNE